MEEEARIAPVRPDSRSQVPLLWFLGVAVAVVALDQLTKLVIVAWLDKGDRFPSEGPLRLVHVTNTGAAFGMFQGAGFLLALASIAGVAAIAIYMLSPGFAHPLLRFCLALMLGGAMGNLVDRIRNGEVVDFLKFPAWPAFNVADSAISVGVVLLLWVMIVSPPAPDGS